MARTHARPKAPVEVEAAVTLHGPFRQPPREASATITMEALAGTVMHEIGRVRPGESSAKGEVFLPKGLYRVVARGEVTLADGTRQPFVARGPFVRVGE